MTDTYSMPENQVVRWRDRTARDLILRRLASLRRNVHLRFREQDMLRDFGAVHHANEGASASSLPRLTAELRIHDASFYSRTLQLGEIGFAESYIDGHWTTDNLPKLLRIFVRNLHVAQSHGILGWVQKLWHSFQHRRRRNSRSGSARNIAAHYDLSNDFFRLFLDETMSYSSALFGSADWSLREASEFKLRRICQKLDLRPQDHLLEIGTGWGGLALHIAEQTHCRITTTTISPSQFQEAERRFCDAGVSDRVRLLQSDYRDLRGHYDKLVSVEMIEAVGDLYLDLFFKQCSKLLRSDGRLVVQAIVMDDRRYRQYVKKIDFIRHAIFPGGCLPSLARMQTAVAKETDFRLLHLEDMTPHYAKTLARWRHNFLAHRKDVISQGFDERFVRMWDFYLSYCEAAFEERFIQSMQLVWGKPECRWDPILAFPVTEEQESDLDYSQLQDRQEAN
jgi:cyclopropane-fatty-acyl-phospholipid synthase